MKAAPAQHLQLLFLRKDAPAMATLKVGINGFGRIGRLVLRAAIKNPNIEFVGINDLVPPKNLAYLLKYDSTHGRYNGTVEAVEDGIVVDGKFIPCTAIRNPSELPWGERDTDYVVECTGLFTQYDGAHQHIQAGAKRVIISAPTKDPDRVPTLLMGVNHETFDARNDLIVSNASCTTNCLAPIAKVINDNFGLAEGLMTTIHASTATQPTVDARDYFLREKQITVDHQREKEYVRVLSRRIVEEYHKYNRVFASHLVAFTAFKMLERKHPNLDLYSIIRLADDDLILDYDEFEITFNKLRDQLDYLYEEGLLRLSNHMKDRKKNVIEHGLKNVGLYHDRRPLIHKKDKIIIQDTNTLYYYHNRMHGYELEKFL